MRNFVAVYDACVLYPAPLRDLLMRLALTGLFRARWTHRIQTEWIDALLRNRPDLSRAALESTAAQMNGAVDDCLVHRWLRNPPVTIDRLFDAFLRQGLAATVSALREHAATL